MLIRIFNGFRFVFPIKFQNKHIGSLELSTSLLAIIDQMYKGFEIPAQFIIKKDVVESKVFTSELLNYIKWDIDENFYLDKDITEKYPVDINISDELKTKIRKTFEKNKALKTPFVIDRIDKNSDTMILLLPIPNFNNEIVGYLISYTNINEIGENRDIEI